MADVGLAGGDPPFALSQDVSGKAVASACASECCSQCRLYWACDPCDRPNYDPSGRCGGEPPEPFPECYIEQGIHCESSGVGPLITPGNFIVIDGWCYEVLEGDYYRPELGDCTGNATPIPPGSCIVDYLPPDAPSGTPGVFSLPCIEDCSPCNSPSPFAQAIPCGGSEFIYYFCRAELDVPCRYGRLPVNESGELGCFAFKADAPPIYFQPPEDQIVAIPPSSDYGSCCECNRGGDVQEACVWVKVETNPIDSSPIAPALECCCGTEDAAAASVATITNFTYEQIVPTQRLLVELVGTPSGPVGVTMSVTLRQRYYLPGSTTPVIDETFPADFTIPVCGPLFFPPNVSDPGRAYSIVSQAFDCNSASLTMEFGSPDELYEKYTWAYTKTAPAVTEPCVGGCDGSLPRASEVVRWLGMDWYGTPFPLRLWYSLVGKQYPDAGCGCNKKAKDQVAGLRRILGDWRGSWL